MKRPSPKANTPPSRATVQYPPPSVESAMPTTGWLSTIDPVDPQNGRFPKLKIPPSLAVIR